MARDEQDDGRPARLPEPLQQREPIHFGQHEIGQHHRRMLRFDEAEGFLTRGSGLDVVPPLPHQPGQPVALGRLVVDDENFAALHLIPSCWTHSLAFPAGV